MDNYTYSEQLLEELIKKEEPYYSIYNISAEQRLEEHQEIRKKYNQLFKDFADREGIELKEILPLNYASNRWFFLKGENKVSVYFDIHCTLGFHSEPYFEMFPNKEGDAPRFTEEEVYLLLKEILEMFN